MLAPGIMLQDRYEILEQIGSGGMSEVYKAKCHKLNRLVGIKVLKAEFTSDAGFVSKFKMEAQAAAGMSHPNIVNIYDVVDEGDLHCIVMELVEGITLKSYINKKGHLGVKESIGIAIQVAQGIEAAHDQHIIHRDIKPQNMLISKDGKVKVADFGIARAVSSQTMNSTVVGSVHYVSPEQARGGFVDARTDIYSLGITMFEMLTGKVPFEGDNTVTVALAHLEEPIVLPSMLNPEIPPAVEQIILKCTEKKPENRYASISDLISDLRKALINPEDISIGAAVAPELSSDTIMISKKEMDVITSRAEKADVKQHKKIKEELYEEDVEEDESSTHLEKLLTAFGVVAAIVVVAVVVVVFSKLGGLFKENNPLGSSGQITVEANSDEISQKEVRMPKLVGNTQEEAESKLAELDLKMKVILENSDEIAKGTIISQENAPDSVVPRYSSVIVTVSGGSDKVELEGLGLTQMTLDTAVRLLEGKGLKATVVEENHEEAVVGSILRYEPLDKASLGDTVTLYVSKGPEVQAVAVPKLEGQSSDWAVQLLTNSGLVVGSVTEEHHDTVPVGCVISQAIAAGEEIEIGTVVDFVVSKGPEPPETQYLASLEASYPLRVSYGPGAPSAEIQIVIRLKQNVNGEIKYTQLTEPKTYSTDTMLDIRFTKIRGADGVSTGEVEIVDMTNNLVLNTYTINFFEIEV
ncbi:MAG: Stk1 family PASTA domain-containing Ser/Thr kinase [Lachnoclostridium sp.]|nr:Stk1 family PASTA domain-containing Ser/Thr kinase [Lachnoclostridium sp.]